MFQSVSRSSRTLIYHLSLLALLSSFVAFTDSMGLLLISLFQPLIHCNKSWLYKLGGEQM